MKTVQYLSGSVLMQMLATSEKWKREVMALSLGFRLARHAGVNQHGRYYVSTLLDLSGAGATSYRDGMNSGGYLTAHNVEWIESNFPLMYLFRRHVKDGGGTFRARFGVVYEEKQPDGSVKNVNLLAEGSYSKGSELTDGYPEFTYGVLKKLGWDKDLTADELATINKIGGNNPDGVGWAVDLSGGIIRVTLEHGVMAYGNGKARAVAWNLPDPVPVHREPIYTARPDLVAKYPTRPDGRQFRMANLGFSIQKAAVEKGLAKQFPIILTSGRLVEYEGGGEETRSNRWLAELQQDMFVEVNTSDAAERGIKDGGWVWVFGPENGSKARVKALVTDRVGKGVAFMPFHFAGWFQGVDQRGKYPKGNDPIVLGESVNTLTSYGYDPVTGMHEGKVTLCQIQSA